MSAEPVERFYDGEPDAPAPNVPLHPGVSAVIFDAERRILFMRRTRGGYWCLPGGRIDANESASQCCIRETLEETGLETVIVRLVSVNSSPSMVVAYPDGNVHRSFVLCFEVRVVGGALKLSAESDAFRWCSLGEARDLRLIPDSRLNALDAWRGLETAALR